MSRRTWRIGIGGGPALVAVLLLAPGLALGDSREEQGDFPAEQGDYSEGSGGSPEAQAADLLGPLRVRDMTPFNLLRLDMLPAHAMDAEPGSWAVEANVSVSNTFVMSDNVRTYLGERGGRTTLTQADADAILALEDDAYYVDGEFGLLEVTFHYRVLRRTSLYMTLSAYNFSGGFLDGTVEDFHDGLRLGTGGRDLAGRNQFQTIMDFQGAQLSSLDAPVDGGLGDPAVGLRHVVPLGESRWNLVLQGEAKIAAQGERPFLSSGSNDYGVQAALQGKFRRQAVYFSGSIVSTDGRVLGVELERRVVPTGILAYEVGLSNHTNLIGQLYASQSTIRDSSLDPVTADKFQASLGVRSRRGRMIYGIAVTENIDNFDNTPDIGVTLSLAWAAGRS